jgi:hypothetical protein
VLHRLEVRQDAGEERQERGVDDDHPVLGVVGDVRHLLRGEPDVQRMDDRAHAGHGVVRLHVLLVVPHEGTDAVARADPEFA